MSLRETLRIYRCDHPGCALLSVQDDDSSFDPAWQVIGDQHYCPEHRRAVEVE